MSFSVSNVTPAAGSLLERKSTITFDVTDTVNSIVRIIVAVKYPGFDIEELAYDGAAFTDHYKTTSGVSAILNGSRFVMLRKPVWPDQVTLKVFAFNNVGGQVTYAADWPLNATINVPPPPVPPLTIFPTTGSLGGVWKTLFYDQQHFLGVFDRTYPLEFIYPLKTNPNSGYELMQVAAKIGERLSLACQRLEAGNLILTAEGGQRATGIVEFYRANNMAGAVTVKAGSMVSTSDGGRDFITLADAVFGPTDLGPIEAPIEATAMGYEWNVLGQTITTAGLVLAGEIDEARQLIEDPPYGDPTIQVRNLLPTSGGQPAMLDALGVDRDLVRLVKEEDDHYRLRIRSLPTTITKTAIIAMLDAYLKPLQLDYTLIETWQVDYQTCWDAPQTTFSGNLDYSGDLFAYDDFREQGVVPLPPTSLPMWNRWLDEAEFRGAFIVVIDNNQPILDVGMAFDDPGTEPSDFSNLVQGWQRGTPAFDTELPTTPDTIFPGAYDGVDLRAEAAYFGLVDLLQQIKAYKVAAIIEQAGN